MNRFLVYLAFMLFLTICPCRAADMARLPVLLSPRSEVAFSSRISNYMHLIGIQNNWVDYTFMAKLTPKDYMKRVGLARSVPRSLEDRLNATIDPIRRYPGGMDICDAIIAGMELYTISHDYTSYGNHSFQTGYRLKGSTLNIGIYLNF